MTITSERARHRDAATLLPELHSLLGTELPDALSRIIGSLDLDGTSHLGLACLQAQPGTTFGPLDPDQLCRTCVPAGIAGDDLDLQWYDDTARSLNTVRAQLAPDGPLDIHPHGNSASAGPTRRTAPPRTDLLAAHASSLLADLRELRRADDPVGQALDRAAVTTLDSLRRTGQTQIGQLTRQLTVDMIGVHVPAVITMGQHLRQLATPHVPWEQLRPLLADVGDVAATLTSLRHAAAGTPDTPERRALADQYRTAVDTTIEQLDSGPAHLVVIDMAVQPTDGRLEQLTVAAGRPLHDDARLLYVTVLPATLGAILHSHHAAYDHGPADEGWLDRDGLVRADLLEAAATLHPNIFEVAAALHVATQIA